MTPLNLQKKKQKWLANLVCILTYTRMLEFELGILANKISGRKIFLGNLLTKIALYGKSSALINLKLCPSSFPAQNARLARVCAAEGEEGGLQNSLSV